jgi:hypothetical protein
MSECKAYRREIDGAADGGRMSSDARAHAALCGACGDEVRVRQSLRALVGGLDKVEAPADFEFRLRARMAASKRDGGRGHFGGARWLYGFAPVAVAACFVVVSATLYFRQAPRTPPAVAPAVAHNPAPNVEPDRAPSAGVKNSSTAGAGEVKDVAKVNPGGATSPKRDKPARRFDARAAQSREVASGGERRADVEQRTLVSSVTSAQVLTLIPVKASAEPMRVILRDEGGAERVVSMRSVSFGSQSFLARDAVAKPPAAAEDGGVW